MKKNYSILLLLFLSGIAAPINQFKVPPMMQQLMEGLGISLAVSGWLMSAFALAGFIVALPSGLLLRKIGIKKLGLTALSALLSGSVSGGMADSALPMMIGRFMEGMGMGLFSVAAPAAISAWFPPEKRGMPMGVWSTWVPAGSVIIFILAPFIGASGWRHVWVFSSVYTAVMCVLFLIFFKMPDDSSDLPVEEGRSAARAFVAKDAWLLALIFMLFNIVTIAVKSYMPVFLENSHGFSAQKASGITSIMMVCSMISAPIAGIISDRIRSRKKLLLAACLGAFIAVCMMFHVAGAIIILSLICVGIAGGAMPVGIFTAATELADTPVKAGAHMSVVIFGQYLGMFAGPVIFSFTAGVFGWWIAAYALLPVILAAFIAAANLKIN